MQSDQAMSKTSPPAVTLLMSCYNAQNYLGEALDSILVQDFDDYEAVLINDGSKDGTAEILADYAARDARLRVITQENQGLATALNNGLAQARGTWIARLDADDTAEPSRLRLQMELAQATPNAVFIGSGLRIIDDAGHEIAKYSYPADHAALVANLTTARRFPAHSSAFYRRTTALELQGYRTRIKRSEDVDMWLRLSEVGALACHPSSLVNIRKHSGQLTNFDGNRQTKIDSRVARTAYWLRQVGEADPVEGPEDAFGVFRTWVEQQMEQAGVFKREHMFRRAVQNGTGPARRPNLLKSFLASPRLFLTGIQTRISGDRLPKRFARQWAKRRNT